MKSTPRSAALKKTKEDKYYTSPTGSKHKIGSSKYKYWEDITKRGRENRKYGD